MEQLSIITEVANKVVKQKYPMLGENRYTDFDVATILHSYFVVAEHMNEISTQETVQKQPQIPG